MSAKNSVRCKCCKEIFLRKDLLSAPNPFDIHVKIHGCPYCKAVNTIFESVCDNKNCDSLANVGWDERKGNKRVHRFTCASCADLSDD